MPVSKQQTTVTESSTVVLRKGSLFVEAVSGLENLSRHAAAWNELAWASPQRLPMASYAWVVSYFDQLLSPGSQWICFFVYDGAMLLGVLPLEIGYRRSAGISRLTLNTPLSPHTCSVDLLLKAGRESETLELLIEGLAKAVPSWQQLELKCIPDLSPSVPTLSSTRLALVISTLSGFGAYIPVDGSYQKYLDSLSRNFSHTLRRVNRKLSFLSDVRELFVERENVRPEHLDRFLDVEATGWKAAVGTAIKQSDQLISFYRALTARLAELGWLEYHFLEAEGKTIAAHLAVRMGRSLVLLKIGYDDAYAAYAPGNNLMARVVEWAFARSDIDEINCLTDMAWHRNWQMPKRAYYDIRLYRKSPQAFMTGYLPERVRRTVADLPGVSALARILRKRRSTGSGPSHGGA
ncbi:MAG: GNAT family N-acetyltransferase [Candidatus Zixiibacteriota bacterium]